METFTVLLAFGARNSPVTGEFPTKKASVEDLWCFIFFFLSAPEFTIEQKNEDAGDLWRHRAHYDVTVMNICTWLYKGLTFCLSNSCMKNVNGILPRLLQWKYNGNPLSWLSFRECVAWRPNYIASKHCMQSLFLLQFQNVSRRDALWIHVIPILSSTLLNKLQPETIYVNKDVVILCFLIYLYACFQCCFIGAEFMCHNLCVLQSIRI